jgi:hypothetical protein
VGEFNGDTEDSVTSGREFCMAVNIAYRLGHRQGGAEERLVRLDRGRAEQGVRRGASR